MNLSNNVLPKRYQPLSYKAVKRSYVGKWFTSDNETGDATLKQHFYIEKECTEPYTHIKYSGNRGLCSRGGLSDDGEKFLSLSQIEGEIQKPDCCGRCRNLIAQREAQIQKLNEEKKNYKPKR